MPLLLFRAIILFLVTTKAYSQILTACPDNSNYTSPSPFKSNLDTLLANLVATTPRSAGYFANITVGDSSSSPVYGLAQCRADASASDCSNCLNLSVSAAPSRCPLRKSAAFRFDLCVLRYSDQRFFSQVDAGLLVEVKTSLNASNTDVFNRRLNNLMNELSSEAVVVESRFAAGMTNYSDFSKIYGMVQCTRDLSPSDCSACLAEVLNYLANCCYGIIQGKVLTVSCTVAFDTTSFFSLSLVPPPPSSPKSVSEPPPPPTGLGDNGKSNNTTKIVLIIVIPVVAALMLLSVICIYLQGRKKKSVRRIPNDADDEEFRSSESLLFDLSTLRAATNNFSDANKLGEGGFGPVYKGSLHDGQEIAVKRLSRSSGQGLVELRNEVILVAKLQHRNLVRLVGCCLEGQEKLLVYEYLPNTSLDKFLFDPIEGRQLQWGTRYKIIEGIGRGLLYLHEDSQLRIIHRDLKASNILLDGDMNPKISDFGLAKLFGVDETHRNTSRIAGTYGYMAPEYAMHGLFSTKSDVFSYGVLILEIVTGRKNSGFQGSGHAIDLPSHVWHHWNQGNALQVKDRNLGANERTREVLRCIHIGLLCVQEAPSERPSMAMVALMLSSYSVTLPAPSAPAFYIGGSTTASESGVLARTGDIDMPEGKHYDVESRLLGKISLNDVSISEIDPR